MTDPSTAEVQKRLDAWIKGSALDEGMYVSLSNKLKRLDEFEGEHESCHPEAADMIVAKYNFESRWSVPNDIGPECKYCVKWDKLEYKNAKGDWVEHHGITASDGADFKRPDHLTLKAEMDEDLWEYYAEFEEHEGEAGRE